MPELYQELQRDRTLMNDPVSPGVKLAVTLWHLGSGDSYTTLQYAFRVASLTIEKFVPEVCDAITRTFWDQVMQCPTLPEDWLLVESIFHQMEGIFQLYVHKGEAASSVTTTVTTRASTLLYSWPGGWRLQFPMGGSGVCRVNFRCSDFQAYWFKAQNRGQQQWLPWQ